jgi:alanine racemase
MVGRICMDQSIVDLGPDSDCQPGDIVEVIGGSAPGPAEAASAMGTSPEEIVSRIGPRVIKRFVDEV